MLNFGCWSGEDDCRRRRARLAKRATTGGLGAKEIEKNSLCIVGRVSLSSSFFLFFLLLDIYFSSIFFFLWSFHRRLHSFLPLCEEEKLSQVPTPFCIDLGISLTLWPEEGHRKESTACGEYHNSSRAGRARCPLITIPVPRPLTFSRRPISFRPRTHPHRHNTFNPRTIRLASVSFSYLLSHLHYTAFPPFSYLPGLVKESDSELRRKKKKRKRGQRKRSRLNETYENEIFPGQVNYNRILRLSGFGSRYMIIFGNQDEIGRTAARGRKESDRIVAISSGRRS